jgi:hypothetical protein
MQRCTRSALSIGAFAKTAWRNLSMNVRTLVSAILLANGSSGDGSRVALATSPLRF